MRLSYETLCELDLTGWLVARRVRQEWNKLLPLTNKDIDIYAWFSASNPYTIDIALTARSTK